MNCHFKFVLKQAQTFERRGVSYSCSKAALNMLTKMVSIELPEVNAISLHPGWVQTDMVSNYEI